MTLMHNMNLPTMSMSQNNMPMHDDHLQALLQTEASYNAFNKDFPSAVHSFRKDVAPWIYRLCESFDLAASSNGDGNDDGEYGNADLAWSILNCLDRFTATLDRERQCHPQHYRLAALTCLYTVVKAQCVKSLSLDLMQKVAAGQFSEELIEQMEMQLLQQLQWKLHPITPMEFVRQYMEILGLDGNDSTRRIQELCGMQIHTAMQDFDNVTRNAKPSHIALAALANAMECMEVDCGGDMLQDLANTIDILPSELVVLRRQLVKSIADYGNSTTAKMTRRAGASDKTAAAAESMEHSTISDAETSSYKADMERRQRRSKLQRQDSPRSILSFERNMQF